MLYKYQNVGWDSHLWLLGNQTNYLINEWLSPITGKRMLMTLVGCF